MTESSTNEIFSYELTQLESLLAELGQPPYRAKQVYEWLHKHNVVSYDEMSNLPKDLRDWLTEHFPITKTEIIKENASTDLSRKFLLEHPDKTRTETVGIVSPDNNRLTVCFSTQVGCSMGCTFCATGQEGFTRNLTVQEIINQIITVKNAFDMRVSNLVAMGQGEPFLNYDNLIQAIRRANTDEGLGVGARHITVSTCGILNGINRFANEPEQFTLAVSLHSAIQSKRNQLMPRLANQPLSDLHNALAAYLDKKHRRITFEYTLIDGINSTEKDLAALIEYCEGLFCHINLIPLNAIDNSIYLPPDKETIYKWEKALNAEKITTTIRNSRGSDIAGACGQLKNILN